MSAAVPDRHSHDCPALRFSAFQCGSTVSDADGNSRLNRAQVPEGSFSHTPLVPVYSDHPALIGAILGPVPAFDDQPMKGPLRRACGHCG